MVAHAISSSTWEAEIGRSMWVQGQPSLQSKFEDSQGCYTEKFCVEKSEKKKTVKKKRKPIFYKKNRIEIQWKNYKNKYQ